MIPSSVLLLLFARSQTSFPTREYYQNNQPPLSFQKRDYIKNSFYLFNFVFTFRINRIHFIIIIFLRCEIGKQGFENYSNYNFLNHNLCCSCFALMIFSRNQFHRKILNPNHILLIASKRDYIKNILLVNGIFIIIFSF